MSRHYTSIEQSKRLLKLGLSPETADMYYQVVLPRFSDKFHHVPEVGEPLHALEWYNKGYTKSGKNPLSLDEYCIPCWSTDALLQLLPFECNLHAFNTECGKVYRLESFKYQKAKTYSTSIEAVFAIVVVYLENPEPQLYRGIEGYGFEQDLKWMNRSSIKCELCNTEMVWEEGKVYASNPPMYGYKCPKCGHVQYSI